MLRLPISGIQTHWRPSNGYDDIALADSRPGLAGALACVARAVEDAEAAPLDGTKLPIGDIDLLVVARLRELRGDTFVAEGRCEHCGAAVDVQFSLAEYATHHRPRRPRAAAPEVESGWWRLSAHDVTFRVPVACDVLTVMTSARPREELFARCVRGSVGAHAARAVERAMTAIAPTLRGEVAGSCPECKAMVMLEVDARELCMTELRFMSASVYDDVNLIASVYQWSEDAILNLASQRRRRYADLIAGRSPELQLPAAEMSVA